MENMIFGCALLTGGFDPIHSGHIHYLQDANKKMHYAYGYGNFKLFVGLNSDDWLIRKKGTYFLPFFERKMILEHNQHVDDVFGFDDSDDSANKAIEYVLDYDFGKKHEIVFCNGGDKNNLNIPEVKAFNENPLVLFWHGIGGSYKSNSSSDILKSYVERLNYVNSK